MSSEKQVRIDCIINGQPLLQAKYLTGLSYEQNVDGASKGSLKLFDKDWDFIENLVLSKGFGSSLSFRFGWQDNLSEWIDGVVLDYVPEFTNSGVNVEIPFRDLSVNDNQEAKSGPPPASACHSAQGSKLSGI